MIRLKDVVDKILIDADYIKLESYIDKNLFESYFILGELLNPDNSYNYKEKMRGYWVFTDNFGYDFFIRIFFQPLEETESYFEMKMGWEDLEKQQKYLRQPAREIDEKRSDTIAKIYKEELIPFFLDQNLNDSLKILPLDIKRYQFFKRLVDKFTPKDKLEIIENKPTEITLKKK